MLLQQQVPAKSTIIPVGNTTRMQSETFKMAPVCRFDPARRTIFVERGDNDRVCGLLVILRPRDADAERFAYDHSLNNIIFVLPFPFLPHLSRR